MLGRYTLLAGSIYKSKLNDFAFYNLKDVKLHVVSITEKSGRKDRTLDTGTKQTQNFKFTHFRRQVRRTKMTSFSLLAFYSSYRLVKPQFLLSVFSSAQIVCSACR
jgi:hypothetical protein